MMIGITPDVIELSRCSVRRANTVGKCTDSLLYQSANFFVYGPHRTFNHGMVGANVKSVVGIEFADIEINDIKKRSVFFMKNCI
jgi:hypothetical protein